MPHLTIDKQELRSLDYSLSLPVHPESYLAVAAALGWASSLLRANIPEYGQAQNEAVMLRQNEDYGSTKGGILSASLRVCDVGRIIQITRLQLLHDSRVIAEHQAPADQYGRYRVGAEVVKIWEADEAGIHPVVTIKRIQNGAPAGGRFPKDQTLDDFQIRAGRVLEEITGTDLSDADDVFVAGLTQDYLRTHLYYPKLNHPEYFAPH